MNGFKKGLTMLLGLTMAFSAVGCGGTSSGSGSGKKLKISIMNVQGGIGSEWLKNAIDKYEVLAADKVYGDKVGVTIEEDTDTSTSVYINGTDGHDIIVLEKTHLNGYIQQDALLDLTELYQRESAYDSATIEQRMKTEVKGSVTGLDGKYYALPHYEFFSGITYNKELFDEGGYYFALDAENGAWTGGTSKYGTALFIKNADSKKSYGPDGKTGVENGVDYSADDGLPSTLEELIILCSVLKDDGIEPFQLSGGYINYSNSLTIALWSSLAGYEQISTVYDLNGEIEVIQENYTDDMNVTSLKYTSENLFTGIDYIKKPEVETITVTPDNGYKTFDMSSKYYAAAFLEIAEKEGFISSDSKKGTVSHIAAQENFLVSSKKKAMLMEGSYWYNETLKEGNAESYSMKNGGRQLNDLDIRFMPMPTYLNEADKAARADKDRSNVLVDTGYATMVVLKQVGKDENRKKAVLDFLEFLYSEEELKNFTKTTGLGRPFNYDLNSQTDFTEKGKFMSNLWDLKERSKIMYRSADNNIFRVYGESFSIDMFWGAAWQNADGKSYLNGLRNNKDTVDLIQQTRITAGAWQEYKKVLNS